MIISAEMATLRPDYLQPAGKEECRSFDDMLLDQLFSEISDEAEELVSQHVASCEKCRLKAKALRLAFAISD